MSSDDSNYFYVLNQAEIDLKIDHDRLLTFDRTMIGYLMEKWFERRGNITGDRREVSEQFKDGVFRTKELVKELEES